MFAPNHFNIQPPVDGGGAYHLRRHKARVSLFPAAAEKYFRLVAQ